MKVVLFFLLDFLNLTLNIGVSLGMLLHFLLLWPFLLQRLHVTVFLKILLLIYILLSFSSLLGLCIKVPSLSLLKFLQKSPNIFYHSQDWWHHYRFPSDTQLYTFGARIILPQINFFNCSNCMLTWQLVKVKLLARACSLI